MGGAQKLGVLGIVDLLLSHLAQKVPLGTGSTAQDTTVTPYVRWSAECSAAVSEPLRGFQQLSESASTEQGGDHEV